MDMVNAMSKFLCSISKSFIRQIEPAKASDVGLFLTDHGCFAPIDTDDGVSNLCLDTILSGFAALVFCPTKQWCEQLAESMAKQVSSRPPDN